MIFWPRVPTRPPGRERFACVGTSEGVVTLPGHTGDIAYGLEWEGTVPGLERTVGGGSVDGVILSDIGIDYAQFDVRVGDWVEVLSSPAIGVSECTALVGLEPSACEFERRVTDIVVIDGETRLQLDSPLPQPCFEGVSIAYRIRMGGGFSVSSGLPSDVLSDGGGFVARLNPGQRLGPSGAAGQTQPVMFELLAMDAREDLPACDRYDGAGSPIGQGCRR